MTDSIETALRYAGIVPVITIADSSQAIPLARTLVESGLPVLEVTLRTDAGLESLRLISQNVPGTILGAGTVRHPTDIDAAVAAGARFLVSPGTPPHLVTPALRAPVPFLPGCATPSEAMALADAGFGTLKFFPAASYGGPSALQSFAAPLTGISFVPTGGIGPDTLESYLRLPNVLAVGGSWMVRPDWLAAGDYDAIATTARAAAEAVRTLRSGG